MADVEPDLRGEIARLRRINRDLSALRLRNMLAEHSARQRILQLFHDGIVQRLIGVQLRIDNLAKADDPVLAEATVLKEIIDTAIQTSHVLMDELAPHVLSKAGLEAAVRELLGKYGRAYGILYRLHVRNADTLCDETVSLVLYDILRRLLHGVVCSCHASKIAIRIQLGGPHTEIVVEDNGLSLDVEDVMSTGQINEQPFILELTEDVRFLGGNMWVERYASSRVIGVVLPRRMELFARSA